jgi:hypothetical protein
MTDTKPMLQCSLPPPLTEDQLSAALDGTADAAVQAHVRDCPYCAERLAAARQLETTLNQSLYHWDAPSPDELADYVMNLLDPSARQRIDAYLQTSPSARAEVAQLSDYLNLDALPAKRARPESNKLPRFPSLDKIIAVLLPKKLQPALRGGLARGELTAQGRGVTVFIEYFSEGDACTITGQVIANEPGIWDGALAQLFVADTLTATALLESGGDFKFTKIAPSTYELRIASETHQVIVVHEVAIEL